MFLSIKDRDNRGESSHYSSGYREPERGLLVERLAIRLCKVSENCRGRMRKLKQQSEPSCERKK